jgi:hypothetical protein
VSDRDVVRVILAPVRNASANCAPGCLASATASICVAWRTPRRPHRTMRRASCGRPQRRARRPVSRSHRQRGEGWLGRGGRPRRTGRGAGWRPANRRRSRPTRHVDTEWMVKEGFEVVERAELGDGPTSLLRAVNRQGKMHGRGS